MRLPRFDSRKETHGFQKDLAFEYLGDSPPLSHGPIDQRHRHGPRVRPENRPGLSIVPGWVHSPAKFSLTQNFPNPFNPSTQIVFSVTKEGPVTLRVFDILGREVATLVNGNRKPGEYTERFDGTRLASGVYMYVLQAAEGRLTSRMILSK